MKKERVFTFPGRRVCEFCPDLVFEGLEDHADHLALHNPRPAAWATAHEMIEAAKERSKKAESK